MDGTVDFFRNWQNYKLGFGQVYGEHWLGLDNIHDLLSSHDNHQLWVDLETTGNEMDHASYDKFDVGDEESGYVLTIGSFLGSTTVGKVYKSPTWYSHD